MCTSMAGRRALRLLLVFALAALLVPLEIAPAEAGRIKFRVRSSSGAGSADRADERLTARPRSPISVRIRSSSGSGSNATERRDDQKARPRTSSAAAAAAARARTALEAERAAQAAKGVPAGSTDQPVPVGKTTSYANGVTCIAGC